MVTLCLVLGSTIVIVWSSLGKFLTVDSVRMSKGRPSKMVCWGSDNVDLKVQHDGVDFAGYVTS
jgi:hypothetical protein